MDLDYLTVDEVLNESSYENFTNDMNDDGHDEQPLPYEIPDCPPGSILQFWFYIPDHLISMTFLYSFIDKFIITNIYPVIFAVGILTNVAFLFTVARVPQMWTTLNFYFVNLACADLILILTKGVNSFYRYIWSSYIKNAVPFESPAACGLINSVTYLGYYASIWLVTLVSIERFLAICHPLKHHMMKGKRYTIKMISTAWLIAFIFTAVSAPNYSTHYKFCIVWPAKWQNRLPTVLNFCLPSYDYFYYVLGFTQAIPFSIALILNSILYFLIIHRLGHRDIAKGEGKRDQQKQADKVRNAVTRMLIINGIVFFLCLAPFQFYNAYLLASKFANFKQFLDPEKMKIVARVSRILDLVNSSVNPIIYSATNARYRQAFLTAFGCGKKSLNTKATLSGDKKTVKTISSGI